MGDVRMLFGAGYALMLQVAHPTVGAGVRDFSNFAADPWGRLMRTLDYLAGLVFAPPEIAALTARRVRDMHKSIKGIGFDGEPYHALEPSAYAWVHATLMWAAVEAHRQFGRRLTSEELEGCYAEWRGLGRLLGIGERDLPEGWGPYADYVEGTMATELGPNVTVQEVAETFDTVALPLPGRRLRARLGRAGARPLAGTQRLMTGGMLGPDLRTRLELDWTAADERRFRALCRSIRLTNIIPRPVLNGGPLQYRLRARQIEAGPFEDLSKRRRQSARAD